MYLLFMRIILYMSSHFYIISCLRQVVFFSMTISYRMNIKTNINFLRRLVVALSGNDQSALSQSAAICGPLPMLNVRRGIRRRGLMPRVLFVYDRDCYRDANAADSAGPPHNESTLRHEHRPACFSAAFFFLLNRFHRLHLAARIALSSAAVPHRFYYSRPHLHAVAPLPRWARASGT